MAGDSAAGGILRHATDLAVERRVEKISFRVPPDHPFTAFCREYGCMVEERTSRNAEWMGRMLNQGQCLGRVAGELTRRLARSPFADWSGSLDIATDLDTTRLVLRRRRVSAGEGRGRVAATLRLPQGRLTQLLFGFHSAEFLLKHGGVRLRGAPVGLVDALFPPTHAHLWVPDHI